MSEETAARSMAAPEGAAAEGAAPEAVARLFRGLLPEQRQIVTTLDRPVFVAAGAGSGKTFTLTRRIVWALCPGSGEGGRPYLDSLDQALVITFTEKAAGEIKERVRSALREAGLAEEALGVDAAWVSTIHHMCARILRTHALDLGLDPQFAMVGEQEARVLRRQATEDALAELDGDPGLDALFAEYSASSGAFGRGEGVLGLVAAVRDKAASAVSGLDSLAFADASVSVANVMASLAESYEALCGCDSKYPDELERCREALGRLRAYCELAPGRRTAEAAAEVLEGLYRPNGNKWRAKAVKQFCTEAQQALGIAAGEVALARAQALEEPLMRLARRIDVLYAEEKRARRVLDNDDLLQLLARAFREHPEIADAYSSKFRLVMVDEFQDTNGQQVSMVKGLSGPGACHLTTVGDAQQAIYGFRGADVGVFEDRGAEVGEAGAVRLDYNFRSDDAILRFVARVCGTTGIVPAFMDLRAKPNRESDFPEDRAPRVVVELTRAHKLGARAVPKAERGRIAARQLADRLARIREAGVEPRRMAVLMRSLNDADTYIAALRARGLESVVVGGSTFARAPEVRTVLALLRTLANPQDTKSGVFPLLSSGMFALDADDMLLLATKPQEVLDAPAKRRINVGAREGEPFFGDVGPSERLVAARRVLGRAWARVGALPVADVCLMAVRESGWLARLEGRGVSGRAVAANVLAAIRHVRELAEPAALDAIRAADEFGRWLDAAKEGPASLSGEGLDAVSLMTAHASKGLEFDVVAVVGSCGSERPRPAPRLLSRRDGERVVLSLAPSSFTLPDLGEDAPAGPEDCASPLEWRSLMEAERAESETREDGRLLYVALTRAKECVVLAMDVTEKKDESLSPAMANDICHALFAERPRSGEEGFDYGGAASGLARTVDVSLAADGSVEVDDGDTGIEDAAAGEGGTDGGACVGAAAATGLAVEKGPSAEATDGRRAFELFDIDAETHARLGSWRPREGVFSYSSAHRARAAGLTAPDAHDAGGTPVKGASLTLDDVLDLPVPEPVDAAETARAAQVPRGEAPAEGRCRGTADVPAALPWEDDSADPAETDDADRATSLGSAFHELARYMVETGHAPADGRVDVVARTYGVGRRDLGRLRAALARWEGSDLRREVLAHGLVRAEVPFFCEVASPLGSDLEGVIDLLATDEASTAGLAATPAGSVSRAGRPQALLVDYKTGDHGLTYAQIRSRHEMQARFYASVLRRQGFGDVDCAFVCVELEDGAGRPVVTRYRFR